MKTTVKIAFALLLMGASSIATEVQIPDGIKILPGTTQKLEKGSSQVTLQHEESGSTFEILQDQKSIQCTGCGEYYTQTNKRVSLKIFMDPAPTEQEHLLRLTNDWVRSYYKKNGKKVFVPIGVSTTDAGEKESSSSKKSSELKPFYTRTYSLNCIEDAGRIMEAVEHNQILGTLLSLQSPLKLSDSQLIYIAYSMGVPADSLPKMLASERSDFQSYLAKEIEYGAYLSSLATQSKALS